MSTLNKHDRDSMLTCEGTKTDSDSPGMWSSRYRSVVTAAARVPTRWVSDSVASRLRSLLDAKEPVSGRDIQLLVALVPDNFPVRLLLFHAHGMLLHFSSTAHPRWRFQLCVPFPAASCSMPISLLLQSNTETCSKVTLASESGSSGFGCFHFPVASEYRDLFKSCVFSESGISGVLNAFMSLLKK